MAARRKFFDNKERLQKLKTLVASNDTAEDLDRKMLAVVVKADQPELFTIIRTLFHAFTEVAHKDEIDLGNQPACWDQIKKFDLAQPFWQFIKNAFGYSEESPSLRNLLIRLLVTDYAHHLPGNVPQSLENLILPKSGQSNVVVCLAQWRDSSSKGSSDETAKSALSEKPPGTVKAKRRYLLGYPLPDSAFAWHDTTAATAGTQGDMEFWIPRAANRFHFMGSKHFVHGGAMLQEIVVPVITVRHKKDKAIRGETKTKPVTVHVLGTSHKITTPRHRFALLQMEPVSERIKPITLKVAVYESDELVTNIETVTFDSASGNMDERKQWVPLVLRDRQYDKKRRYRLVLRDAETGIEQSSVDVIIGRAFDDDF